MAIGNVRLGVVVIFSDNHIRSSIHFAKLAWKYERKYLHGIKGFNTNSHRSFVIGSIIMSSAFAEAYVNELIVGPHNPWNEGVITEKQLQSVRSIGLRDKGNTGRYSETIEKYKKIVEVLQKRVLNIGRGIWQDLDLLIKIRNHFMHFQSYTSWLKPRENEINELWKTLEPKITKNPVAEAMGHFYWPDIALGYGCARWAVKTIIAAHDEFNEMVDLTKRHKHLIKELPY